MKNAWMLLLVLLSLSMLTPDTCQAQLFKGFGKKVEKKINNKIEQKADRHVDKTINTADRKSDKSIEEAVKGDGRKKEDTRKQKGKSNKKNKDTSQALDQNIPVRKDQAITMISSSACNDFLWFKKGTIFEYEHKGIGSKDQPSQMRVVDVTQRGGKTISEIATNQKTEDGTVEFTLNYICDGDNFYLDMSAMLEQVKQQMDMGASGAESQVKDAIESSEFDISEGYAIIPKVLYPGMRLPDVSLSFTMNMSGMEMVMNSDVTDRVVMARETVTTKAGTFECMKIRSTTTVNMNMMGRDISSGTTTDYAWMAPEVGLVKQETYSDKNKMDFSTTLTKLER